MQETRGHYLIGLDAGTTSVKGVLVAPDGRVLAVAREDYTLETPDADICELEASVYWDRTRRVLSALLQEGGIPPEEVRALAFSSQGETFIPVDAAGRPLRKAIVWLDNRSRREAGEIEERFGREQVQQVTGQPEVLPIWPATRILWMRRHEPQLFKRVHKFLLLPDYLVYRLTGKFVTEHSIVSSTLYFNFRRKEWWGEMLDFLGTDARRLPALQPPGVAVGRLTGEAARQTGLHPSTLVVTGAYDHPAGAIGAGNIEAGIVTETTGGAMAMCVTLDRPVTGPAVNLPCHCHAVPDKYFLLPYGQTAGMVLRWFRDNFFHDEASRALREGRDPYDVMTQQAAAVPPGADGLVMLPHLMGSGSPEFDSHARGVFYGVTLKTTRAHFIRAILEAVACMIRANTEALPATLPPLREMRVLGGGAGSALWNQIKADMLGIPVITLRNREAASLGAAILAGVGSGVYEDIRQGVAQVVKEGKTFYPDRDNHNIYTEVYRKYRELYQHNRPLWEKDF